MPEYRKVCAACGRRFTARRKHARACGPSCGQTLRRRRKRLAEISADADALMPIVTPPHPAPAAGDVAKWWEWARFMLNQPGAPLQGKPEASGNRLAHATAISGAFPFAMTAEQTTDWSTSTRDVIARMTLGDTTGPNVIRSQMFALLPGGVLALCEIANMPTGLGGAAGMFKVLSVRPAGELAQLSSLRMTREPPLPGKG